jgi:hypothetical protein
MIHTPPKQETQAVDRPQARFEDALLDNLGWLAFLSPPLASFLYPYIAVAFGKIPLTLWLFVVGANIQRWKERQAQLARPGTQDGYHLLLLERQVAHKATQNWKPNKTVATETAQISNTRAER